MSRTGLLFPVLAVADGQVGICCGFALRLPGTDQMGFLATSLLGIAGSVVGGLIGRLIRPPEEGAAFHPAGFFMSIVGAIILLWAFRSAQ